MSVDWALSLRLNLTTRPRKLISVTHIHSLILWSSPILMGWVQIQSPRCADRCLWARTPIIYEVPLFYFLECVSTFIFYDIFLVMYDMPVLHKWCVILHRRFFSILCWRGFAALPSTLKYSRGVSLDSFQRKFIPFFFFSKSSCVTCRD